MRDPILITGCARSGTSLVAGIIDICGARGGTVCGPTHANKKGQFENREIVNVVIKPYLRSMGMDPMGQFPLPNRSYQNYTMQDGRRLRERVLSVVQSQGVGQEDIWYYKGAKICLIWPLWDKAFPNATWVWVNRDSTGIVESCLKTSFMEAFSTKVGWEWWVEFHRTRLQQMKERLSVIEIESSTVVDDFMVMKPIVSRMGLCFDEKRVGEFVDPSLWNTWEHRVGT